MRKPDGKSKQQSQEKASDEVAIQQEHV